VLQFLLRNKWYDAVHPVATLAYIIDYTASPQEAWKVSSAWRELWKAFFKSVETSHVGWDCWPGRVWFAKKSTARKTFSTMSKTAPKERGKFVNGPLITNEYFTFTTYGSRCIVTLRLHCYVSRRIVTCRAGSWTGRDLRIAWWRSRWSRRSFSSWSCS